MFSIAALFYGDYAELAQRLLDSFQHFDYIEDIRLGLNAVSGESREYILGWAKKTSSIKPVYIFEEQDNNNVGKYPLMRQMFNYVPLADYVMWFDDDSFFDSDVSIKWWDRVARQVQLSTQIGAVHSIQQRNKQFEVIPSQPWYGGKSVNSKHRYRFATGGWWAGSSNFLIEHDYPFKALHHNGGDSILGELIRQQNGTVVKFDLARCHCESCIKKPFNLKGVVNINVGGRAGRRGLGVTGERYVWSNGVDDNEYTHQDFNLKVTTYGI